MRSRLPKVKVIPRSNSKYLTFYQQAGGGPSTENYSCLLLEVITGTKYDFQHDQSELRLKSS